MVATVSEKYISKSKSLYNLFQTWIEPLVTVNLFGATVTKYAKCFFGREDYDDIPEEVKDEELALEMLTMEAFELCKSGEENCVTLEDIENCKVILIHSSRQLLSIWFQETLGHFINENDVHVPNEADFDEMDMNKDGEVCLEEWKEMKLLKQ